MPAYVLIDVKVRDRETYEQYKQLASSAVAAYGGRYLARGGTTETLEGDWQPSRLVVLEFPSMQQGRAWWASPEYGPAKALRQSCADSEMILVDGVSG